MGQYSEKPWQQLPAYQASDFPLVLQDAATPLDDLFDLPEGSAVSFAKVTPTGELVTARWRDTGRLGYYPASTIKWVSAAMMVQMMEDRKLPLDTVLQLGDLTLSDAVRASEVKEDAQEDVKEDEQVDQTKIIDPAWSIRELILGNLMMSDNDFFCILQEAVGFAETYEQMRAWGMKDSMIRRHFKRPRYNWSRPVNLTLPDGSNQTIPARPTADIPLNPGGIGNDEANYFTTDDLIVMAAATLGGPLRHCQAFDLMVQGLSYSNQRYVAEGLGRVTTKLENRPAFLSLNKPGWWPDDGNNVEACYIYDFQLETHYLLGVYIQGTIEESQANMSKVAESIFSALHRDEWAI